jgi:electron transfer flavoprotein beta subunit
MKFAVCVKHVPTGRSRLDPTSRSLDRTGPGELNRFDKNAVEEVVRLKERVPGSEVVAVSMGPTSAVESLRTVLALGADRAILVSDQAAEGSDLLGTARVLAAVLERERPDLVLFGQQSEDGAGGVLLAAVADLMRRPFASQASGLAWGDGGDRVRVTRQTEFGDEVIDVPLPALVSVGDSINEPRYTSLKGVMAARRKPLETVALADVGLTGQEVGWAGARTVVLAIGTPPARGNTTRVEDEAAAAQVIFQFLADRQLV